MGVQLASYEGATPAGGAHGFVPDKEAIFHHTKPLPKWMFYLALFTAYVTPFYMTRCWWMTFMGKPRDKNVYEHAHETRLMYVPLIVLAVGTILVGGWLFRDMIVDAAGVATNAAMVLALDGHAETAAMHAAHDRLAVGVGFAFLIGFLIAWGIYRRGLAAAEEVRRFAGPLYVLLEKKFFFDEMYDFVWVRGCILLAHICRFFDTWFVDLIFDTLAAATERFAAFSGLILDNEGVDGVINGIAKTTRDIGEVARTPQTGRVRNYVLIAAGVATAVIIFVLLAAPEAPQAAVASANLLAP